ncbi:short-chain dehydrogenase [Macrophomina phaseolina]|uniref:Short-chain dehydrogenase n=1 Tax=Macrophomina phaseolina TaxID=35725 RepID=A0ABQ8FSL7_9PEZI|nr:short-chain dehydrogenase [Macrophomina phaseolina]
MSTSGDTNKAAPLQLLDQDLAGKNAVVTGSTRGIGRAITLHLAARGASVLGTCSSPESLRHFDEMNESIRSLYRSSPHSAPKIVGITGNLLSADAPERIAGAVEREFHGKLHILINNASCLETRPIGQLDADYVQRLLLGNIQTLILTVDVLFRNEFFQPNSRIVNISSESTRGHLPNHAFGVYASTKSAMESLTRTWADVFGKHPSMPGTTVNSLLVGATATDAFRQVNGENEAWANYVVSQLSVGTRLGTPEDVAKVAGLLVSDNAGWITGSVVAANGGSGKVL